MPSCEQTKQEYENLKTLKAEFDKGKILYSGDWYKNEDFFKRETPKLEWALTTKEIIPNSINKNYLEQTELIIDYLKNQVFKDKKLPKEYKHAIEKFNKYYQNSFKNKTKEEIIELLGGDNWKEYAQQLSELEINQLTRQTPSEALYDILIYFQNNDQKLLENRYTWTNFRSSDGLLVNVGHFDSDGADVYEWSPGHALDYLGLSFSRG